MISEERLTELINKHISHTVYSYKQFARAIEAEVAAPLEAEIARLHALSACEACTEIPAAGDYIKHLEAQRDMLALQSTQLAERIKELKEENKAAWATADRHMAECSLAREDLAAANALIEQARKQIVWMLGEHNAPNDCYSTGPLTGTLIDNLCPSCYAHKLLTAIEQRQQGAQP